MVRIEPYTILMSITPTGHRSLLTNVQLIAESCKDACFLRENADNDNNLGVCRGQCRATSHLSPIIQCYGRSTKLTLTSNVSKELERMKLTREPRVGKAT